MKKTFLFILFLTTCFCYSQQFTSMLLADQLREEGKYKESIKEYLKLEQNNELSDGTKYNFCKVLALANKIDSCFLYLNNNIDFERSWQVLMDEEFISIKKDKRWKEYEKKVISRYLPCKNVNFSAEILQALTLSKKNKDKKSTNLLINAIKKNGWPKKSEVGKTSDFFFGYYSMFSPFENKFFRMYTSKHLKELENLCHSNEIDCQGFASLYDQIQIDLKKPQKYGTQWFYDNNKVRRFYEFLDRQKIDTWRSEVGLKPISEYAKSWEIELN